MITKKLVANSVTVEQLMLVHDLLQLEGEQSLEGAIQRAAKELALTNDYVELLIEVLVDKGEFALVLDARHDESGVIMLRFVGDVSLDIDEIDLERIDQAGVSKRLAKRQDELKHERKALQSERHRRKRLEMMDVKVNSACEAVERSMRSVKTGEEELARRQATLKSAEAKVIKVMRERDALRAELGE